MAVWLHNAVEDVSRHGAESSASSPLALKRNHAFTLPHQRRGGGDTCHGQIQDFDHRWGSRDIEGHDNGASGGHGNVEYASGDHGSGGSGSGKVGSNERIDSNRRDLKEVVRRGSIEGVGRGSREGVGVESRSCTTPELHNRGDAQLDAELDLSVDLQCDVVARVQHCETELEVIEDLAHKTLSHAVTQKTLSPSHS